MTSAIRAVAVTTSPPAPTPWTARQAINQPIDSESPQAAEASTKLAADTWNTSLRPNRSPNFPASTVANVSASRYADRT
jgi:hypothetical protein